MLRLWIIGLKKIYHAMQEILKQISWASAAVEVFPDAAVGRCIVHKKCPRQERIDWNSAELRANLLIYVDRAFQRKFHKIFISSISRVPRDVSYVVKSANAI